MQFHGYDIEITVRARCRRMTLRFHPGERRLTLSLPPGTSERDVAAFLEERRAWMDAHMQGATTWQPSGAPGERHLLFGRYLVLGQDGAPIGLAALERYRAEKLQALLRELLPPWEARLNVHIARITLREMTSRWGSCRPDRGRLTINLHLSRVPPPLVEYVLVHELCHLHHPDHSAAFHDEMTRLMPDWPARRRALADYDLRPLPPR